MIRTLIVDDDFTVARVHSAYTERVMGFDVVGVAHSGREALELFERLQPDLLVLDVYLPDMSGLEVLQELRHRRAAVDAIIVTAARDAESLRSAMAGGALRYIVKPFNFERFKDTLQSYQRFINRRSVLEAVEQDDVDRLYAAMGVVPDQHLPKNLNRPTLDLVMKCLQEQSRGGERAGAGPDDRIESWNDAPLPRIPGRHRPSGDGTTVRLGGTTRTPLSIGRRSAGFPKQPWGGRLKSTGLRGSLVLGE